MLLLKNVEVKPTNKQLSMKTVVLLILICFGSKAYAQNQDSLKLLAAVNAFHQALIQKNTLSINQVTDKALSYGHSNGWVESKNEMMKNLETNYIGYQSIEMDSVSVVLNNYMANVRFNAAIKATLKGNAEQYLLKVLEVWIKKGNRWILFARQSLKIKEAIK